MKAFAELEKQLQIAKDAYAKSCEAIDASLRTIISVDPSQLKAAKALQASYLDVAAGCKLAAATQPEAPVEKKPKRKK